MKSAPKSPYLFQGFCSFSCFFFVFKRCFDFSAITCSLPGPQPGFGSVPAEEQCGRFLPVPPESQTELGKAAEPGSAASRGAQGGKSAVSLDSLIAPLQQRIFVDIFLFVHEWLGGKKTNNYGP